MMLALLRQTCVQADTIEYVLLAIGTVTESY